MNDGDLYGSGDPYAPHDEGCVRQGDPEGESGKLWFGDRGVLPLAARRALLHLVQGPYIAAEDARGDDWNALITYRLDIESHLNDLFLDLVIDTERGVAFARNAQSPDQALPKAVRSFTLTVADTIMLLSLRRELFIGTAQRIIVGKPELFESLQQYRPIDEIDEASFLKRLEQSWTRMVDRGILRPIEGQDRAEISPVLMLLVGADEVKAIEESFTRMIDEKADFGEQTGDSDTSAAMQEGSAMGQSAPAATQEEKEDGR